MDTTPWTAEIVSKEFVNGILKVSVLFQKGGMPVRDSFETNQGQPDTWLADQISSKISHLESLESLQDSIRVGPVDLEPDSAVQAQTEKQSYAEDLMTMQKMVGAMQQGIISADNPDFVAIKSKLQDNFKADYADLF